eukprot:6615890-Ditylum_brightwellii.AAC.1
MGAASSNNSTSDVRPDFQSPEVEMPPLLDQHHCDYCSSDFGFVRLLIYAVENLPKGTDRQTNSP